MKRILFFAFLFSIGIVALSFALMNVDEVKLSYYLGSIEAPLSLIVVLSLSIGALLGAAAVMGMVLKLKRENSKLAKSIRSSKKELTNLRSLPLKGVS
ncbi:MAG: lipopolysaccharide assembly LapA domain-containing protein [Thiohalomonadales bacterium]